VIIDNEPTHSQHCSRYLAVPSSVGIASRKSLCCLAIAYPLLLRDSSIVSLGFSNTGLRSVMGTLIFSLGRWTEGSNVRYRDSSWSRRSAGRVKPITADSEPGVVIEGISIVCSVSIVDVALYPPIFWLGLGKGESEGCSGITGKVGGGELPLIDTNRPNQPYPDPHVSIQSLSIFYTPGP